MKQISKAVAFLLFTSSNVGALKMGNQSKSLAVQNHVKQLAQTMAPMLAQTKAMAQNKG
jgi:hypothetical protein